MSKDVIRGTMISALGLGIYGLYYGWKINRINEFRRSETAIKLSDDEKGAIVLMHSSQMKKELFQGMLGIIQDDFGFILSEDEIYDAQTSDNFKKCPGLLDYFMKLQDIQKFYSKYYSSVFKKPTTLQDQQFLSEWMLLFDINPEDESINSSNILKFLSDRIHSTLEQKIVIVFNSNQTLRN